MPRMIDPPDDFQPFALQRWMAVWEHQVEHNLCDSGVDAVTPAAVLELAGHPQSDLLETPLGYGVPGGSPELRAEIAALYPGADPEQVLVTTGAQEANFLISWALVSGDSPVTFGLPTYYQLPGLVENLGGRITPLHYRRELDWQPNSEEVESAIPEGTTLVVITDPNNPTAQKLSDDARERIIQRTSEVGAWLLVDEIYRGAERDRTRESTWWGSYERLIVTASVSKAFGLSGLRLGWAVAPAERIDAIWRRHDYTVLGPNPTADLIARLALRHRDRLNERARTLIARNHELFADRLGGFRPTLDWVEPEAGAICFPGYAWDMPSEALCEAIRASHGVLVAPGAHFGVEGHVRIGTGGRPDRFEAGVSALVSAFEALSRSRSPHRSTAPARELVSHE